MLHDDLDTYTVLQRAGPDTDPKLTRSGPERTDIHNSLSPLRLSPRSSAQFGSPTRCHDIPPFAHRTLTTLWFFQRAR